MAAIIKKTISKITLLLFFGLCLGCSSTLYAAQNDEVDDEKDNLGHNGQKKPWNDNKGNKPAYDNIDGKFTHLLNDSNNHHGYKINKRPKDDSSDDEKYEFKDTTNDNSKNKKQVVAFWSCPKCNFINKAISKSCAKCNLEKFLPAENKMGTWPYAVSISKNKKDDKNKLSGHSPINVTFINHEALLLVSYRFKIMFNNSACEISHTYNSLYTAHQHIINTYKVTAKRLVFPAQLALSNENILAYYLTHSNTHYADHGKKLQQYLSSLLSTYYKTKNEGILDVLGIWICDLCKIFNNKHINKKCIKCKSTQLTINVSRKYNSIFDSVYDYWYRFTISVAYADDISLAYVLAKAIQYINNTEEEATYIYCIKSIGESSFVGKSIENKVTSTDNLEWDKLVKQNITAWHKDEIIKKGLEIYIEGRYHHSPKATKITCPNINDAHKAKYSGLDLALQCPIYRDAKENYKFNENIKNHLHFFIHFLDEYKEKPVCRYGAACKAFVRLENNSNSVKDLCHIKLYCHPPRRNRQIQLNENIHQFVCHQNEKDNKRLYKPTDDEQKNLLRLLLDEVIDNGYKYDLCFVCNKKDKYKLFVTGYINHYCYKKQKITILSQIIEDIQSFNGSIFMFECKHKVKNKKNKNSLIPIISKKFDHPRYKKMGRPFHGSGYTPGALMLSLILYTGGDCNYDLCAAQRNGDYDKWKILDLCLWNAIHCLSQKEYGAYKLYSGLKNVKIPKKNIRSGYFPTYTSTTLYKDIAKTFVGTQGMMIEIDPAVRNAFICCDVSWISKFGVSESEVLIARTPKSDNHPVNNFFVKILDDKLGIQTVLLTKRPSYDLACKDIIFKISAIIAGKKADDSKLPADSVVSIFKQLIAGAKEVPYQASKRWNSFRNKQKRIIINMNYMYEHYKAFMPLLIDINCKNLLLLDTIAKLFPNVTQIICRETDCIKVGKWRNGEYSAAIVCSNFILGVKERLSKMDKHTKLTKIVIQTEKNSIQDDCNLYPTQLGALGWQVQREIYKNNNAYRGVFRIFPRAKKNNQITLTRAPHGNIWKAIINEGIIPRISSIIEAKSSDNSKLTSASCISIFKKLITGAKDIPADVQQRWDKLRRQKQRITINMERMYKYYKAFIPLLFDAKLKNLLLLDRIARLFPNVTEIIYTHADYVGIDAKEYNPDWQGYSSAIISSNFILGVQERLSKIDKQTKLTKIVIQTHKHEIKDDCKLYATQFGELGWKIEKRAYENSWGDARKNNQITLTRLQALKPSFPNGSPPQADTNKNKLNNHQSVEDEVFDID